MEDEIRDLFKEISEFHEAPVRLGSRCESNTYYRVEDLSDSGLALCAQYVSERVFKVCSPNLPSVLITLPGNYTGLGEELSRELCPPGESMEVISLRDIERSDRPANWLKGARAVLVNDVITTARSCLEAHTRITMLGASILCWACLIDRTFGPGPVPVVAAFTGAPVKLLE